VITLIPGFLGLCLIIVLSAGSSKLMGYFQPHSLILVVGGTIAIFALSTPFEVTKSVWRSLVGLFGQEDTFSYFQSDLAELAKSKQLKSPSSNPLIAYGAELWSKGIDPDLFAVLLAQKRSELEGKSSDSVQALKNLSKYPPALGMVGTVMGMVSLFANLDQNRGNIGANLSLAMTATFFGLIVANTILSPIADRVHVRQVHQHRFIASVYEILLLINRDEPVSLIQEEVNSRAA